MTATFDALRAFEAADDEWQAELVAAFGKAAGDARYAPHGRGEPGTPLRAAYEARDAARAAYEAARQAFKAQAREVAQMQGQK